MSFEPNPKTDEYFPQMYYYKMLPLGTSGTGQAKAIAFENQLKADGILEYVQKNLKVEKYLIKSFNKIFFNVFTLNYSVSYLMVVQTSLGFIKVLQQS